MVTQMKDGRAHWISQGQLAEELQVSRSSLLKRARAHNWQRHERPRDNPQNAHELPQVVYTLEEADILRREIIEAKQSRKGPWRHPAPRVPVVIQAPPSESTIRDELREINEKLDRLLRVWA